MVENTMVGKDKVLYPELSYQIMNAVYEVHNQLGPGYTEDIYQKALEYELLLRGMSFEKQKTVEVKYKEKTMGIYRLDLVIENLVIVELKAVSELNKVFEQQLLSYLKATGLRLGLLINMGSSSVVCVRKINSQFGKFANSRNSRFGS